MSLPRSSYEALSHTGFPRTLTGRATEARHRWIIERPIAHRGMHGEGRPENSLSAFCAAVDAGLAIELDVRLLTDGNIAVFHYPTTERMTGSAAEIARLDTAALRQLRLAGTVEMIPTLDDVLETIQGRTPLLIDLKAESLSARSLVFGVVERLRHYEGLVAVQSFNPFALAAMHRLAPGIVRGQLSGTFNGIDQMPAWLKAVLRDLRLMGVSRPDFLAYDLTGLPNPRVDRYRNQGMPLLAWTIESEEDARYAHFVADNYICEPF